MTIDFIIRVFLPTLVPLAIGYAMARWTPLSPEPLRRVVRYVLLPFMLFLILLGPFQPRAALIALGAGGALGLIGVLCLLAARQWLTSHAHGAATQSNIAAFALPFLALSWEANTLGIRTAALMFVGAAVIVLLGRGKAGLRALIREPWLYALAGAALCQVLRVPQELPVRALGPLAAACYPLLLVYLGTLLHPLGARWDRVTLVSIGLRLGTGLGVAVVAHMLFPLPRMAFEAALIAALAPPATAAQALVGEQEAGSGGSPAPAGTLISTVAMVVLLVSDW